MSAGLPRVAIVGRQNVGKSTLFNRLLGSRLAIADEEPGATRDRIEAEASWRGRPFLLTDTGGHKRKATVVQALAIQQARKAAESADVILFVCDASTGIQEEDADVAKTVRGAQVPVLVVANKSDDEAREAAAVDLYKLGLGEPLAVSALHGRGTGELLDRVVALLPQVSAPDAEHETASEPRFAIVGRPNVGKSSLFNGLVGEQRSVVYEEAGTTRDSVDALVSWEGHPVRIVDTAGLRRAAKTQGVEYYGVVRSTRSIQRTQVALLVLDASQGLTAEDKKIASRVLKAGRGLAVAANKWDLVGDKNGVLRDLNEEFKVFAGAAVLRTSALSGSGLPELMPALLTLRQLWGVRIPTAVVNETLVAAQDERTSPGGRFRYGTQVSSGPPAFVIFGSGRPEDSYRRFLENRLRASFGLGGVPVRVKFKRRR